MVRRTPCPLCRGATNAKLFCAAAPAFHVDVAIQIGDGFPKLLPNHLLLQRPRAIGSEQNARAESWHGTCSEHFGAEHAHDMCMLGNSTTIYRLATVKEQKRMQLAAQQQCNRETENVKRVLRKKAVRLLAISMLGAATQLAYAGADFNLGDDAGVSLGFGLRTSYTHQENGAPDGTSSSNDFNIENLRLYLSGHYGKILKATFNTERTGGAAATGGDSIRVMDAIAQFEFMDEFNVWMGRMLPPSDRANLDGPFYLSAWAYPGTVSNYPNLAVGRDNGVLVWGKPAGGKLVYSVGAFEGHNKDAALSGASDKLLYAGRIAFNIWDPEPAPAYYTGSTYYGSKDIFTVALAGQTQQDGVGTAAAPGNYNAWNADLLIEKKVAGGNVPTFEAAYYKYELDAVDCGSGEPGSVACPGGTDNAGGQVAGKAYLVGGAWLFPTKVGWGQFQPFVRYQKFDRDLSHTTNKTTDFGLNYIIKGPNAKISAVYSNLQDDRLPAPRNDLKQFLVGVQLQY
jgi:hypothetical protein